MISRREEKQLDDLKKLTQIYLIIKKPMKAKIKEIVWINERNKGEHGPIYYITMKMDNNELITLWKKSKESFKVWDEVNYEVVEEGRKRREIKEAWFPRRSFNQEKQNLWAMIWMSYKLAFEVYYSKEEKNFNETILFANEIVKEAMKTYNEYEKISA